MVIVLEVWKMIKSNSFFLHFNINKLTKFLVYISNINNKLKSLTLNSAIRMYSIHEMFYETYMSNYYYDLHMLKSSTEYWSNAACKVMHVYMLRTLTAIILIWVSVVVQLIQSIVLFCWLMSVHSYALYYFVLSLWRHVDLLFLLYISY